MRQLPRTRAGQDRRHAGLVGQRAASGLRIVLLGGVGSLGLVGAVVAGLSMVRSSGGNVALADKALLDCASPRDAWKPGCQPKVPAGDAMAAAGPGREAEATGSIDAGAAAAEPPERKVRRRSVAASAPAPERVRSDRVRSERVRSRPGAGRRRTAEPPR